MIRTTLRITLAPALIALGWMAGRAQTGEPDFEIVVHPKAPGRFSVYAVVSWRL
jgi:hypothetical protein